MMEQIAKNIKQYRKKSNLSQQDLADRLHVSRQTVSNWERGVSEPDLNAILSLANVFKIEVVDIIYEKRPQDGFQTAKAKRIKLMIILGFLFLFFLSLVFLVVPLFQDHVLLRAIIHIFLYPAVYSIGSAFFMSIAAIWIDFRIQDKRIRLFLISLSVLFIVFYLVFMFIALFDVYFNFNIHEIFSSQALYAWLYSYPIIFVFPGFLLFCGFNRKPQPAQ